MRHTLRLFTRTPLATAAALGALTLAIAASTLVFSVVNGVLLRDLPYKDPSALAVIWESSPHNGNMTNTGSPANFLYWRDRQHTFVDLAAASLTFKVTIAGSGLSPEMVPQQVVTADLFPLLGVSPARGRVFTEAEDVGQKHLVVVSHRYWQTRLGGEASAIGRSLQIQGTPYTVVGVMPAGFSVLDPDVDIWVPFGFSAEDRTPRGRFLMTIARLKPGVAFATAQREMDGIAAELTKKFPEFDTGWGAHVVPLHQQVTGRIRPALLLLVGAVGLVLVIACANVANLLLARGTARRRELAVRAALGAGRGRLVRQLLGESLLLACAAGLFSWLAAAVGLSLLKHVVTDSATVPRLAEVTLDARVILFAMGLTLVAAILAGLAPAMAATRLALVESLKDGLRGSTGAAGARLRPVLVGLEVALAVVLVAGAGLLIRSLSQLLDVKPGFSIDGVQTLALSLSGDTYAQPESRARFYHAVTERVAALPGISAVGAVSFLPMTGLGAATDYDVIGKPKPPLGDEPVVDVRIVDGDYFGAMGIPLLKGRTFGPGDTGDRAHVVVISQALADESFPHEDPIGREIHIDWDSPQPDRIIGVVGNVRHQNLEAAIRPMSYWPYARFANQFMTVTVKSSQAAATIAPAVARVVRGIDPSVPAGLMRPMRAVLGDTLATRTLVMSLLSLFAALALVLAALGIYAVTTAAVAERRAELAIRVALGAAPIRVAALVLRQALTSAAGGAVAGLGAALVLGRFVASMLFEVTPFDLWAMSGTVAALVVVAAFASLAPGRAATQVDPMEALKSD
jgi:putative ABC transport system permease protein